MSDSQINGILPDAWTHASIQSLDEMLSTDREMSAVGIQDEKGRFLDGFKEWLNVKF
jgi:hypothetical protein